MVFHCLYTYVFAGPVTIGFDEANIVVSEDGGNIEVAVSLLQPVAAPVSVDFDYSLETADFDGGSVPHITSSSFHSINIGP